MRMKRRFGPVPNPDSNRWRKVSLYDEFNTGTNVLNKLFVVCLVLSTDICTLVPVGNACENPRLPFVEFCRSNGVPVVTVFANGNAACSTLKLEINDGSKDSTNAPAP